MSHKIVVADGKKRFLDKACEILKSGGFEVVEAQNGTEAQAAARQQGAHLILADYLMPEKSGLGMVFEMRQQGNKTPVVIMTESSLVTDETIQKSGANGLVKKPLDSEALLAAVKHALAG